MKYYNYTLKTTFSEKLRLIHNCNNLINAGYNTVINHWYSKTQRDEAIALMVENLMELKSLYKMINIRHKKDYKRYKMRNR